MDRRRRAARTVALMSLFTMTDTQIDVPIASFYGDGNDLVSLIIGIEPVQAGSGDPSPDNVRPISGWTGATVTRTGKNLFNYTLFNDGTIFSANNDGSITVKTQDTRGWASIPKFYLKAGTYTFSRSNTSGVVQCWNETNSTWVVYFAEGEAAKSFTLSAPAVIQFRIGTQASSYPFNVNIQIELGSTATAYEPYQGQTYTIDLDGTTVYGGTLDVTTGKLTVDRASILLSEFSFDGISSPERHIFRATYNDIIPNAKLPESDTDSWDALCSSYSYEPYSPISSADDGKYAIARDTDRIVFIDHRCSTVEEFAQLNASVQLVYELATPIVYDLTPTQVTTLIGTNNIWADTGDIKYIEYNI